MTVIQRPILVSCPPPVGRNPDGTAALLLPGRNQEVDYGRQLFAFDLTPQAARGLAERLLAALRSPWKGFPQAVCLGCGHRKPIRRDGLCFACDRPGTGREGGA